MGTFTAFYKPLDTSTPVQTVACEVVLHFQMLRYFCSMQFYWLLSSLISHIQSSSAMHVLMSQLFKSPNLLPPRCISLVTIQIIRNLSAPHFYTTECVFAFVFLKLSHRIFILSSNISTSIPLISCIQAVILCWLMPFTRKSPTILLGTNIIIIPPPFCLPFAQTSLCNIMSHHVPARFCISINKNLLTFKCTVRVRPIIMPLEFRISQIKCNNSILNPNPVNQT